jgi:hypothetical protein
VEQEQRRPVAAPAQVDGDAVRLNLPVLEAFEHEAGSLWSVTSDHNGGRRKRQLSTVDGSAPPV